MLTKRRASMVVASVALLASPPSAKADELPPLPTPEQPAPSATPTPPATPTSISPSELPPPSSASPLPPLKPTPSAPTSTPTSTSTTRVWYGAPILGCDLLGVGMMFLGVAAQSPAVIASGGGVYVVGGPVVHLAHGRGLRALGSFGLRVGLPTGLMFAGGFLGYELFGGDRVSQEGSLDPLVGALLGGIAGIGGGMIAASGLDMGALAWDDEPIGRTPHATWLIVPRVSMVEDSHRVRTPVLGLSGSF